MAYFSYESLPPDFTLLQNMAAGAFAGIAVSLPFPNVCDQQDSKPMDLRSILSCSPSIPSK